MEVVIPFGAETKTIQIDLPSEDFIVAKSKNPSTSGTWAEVVGEAIRSPIGAEAIHEQNLNEKKVAIITDDWGRPTPANEVVPLIINQLRLTGVRDSDITFVTASGMHDPMSAEDLERKLGKEIVGKYRCISHDGGDWDNLAFMGISPQGTPIWVNKCVAEADYKVALGRIYLHEAYGYEGGYKMILPGVAGFDTIVRDHSFNFSADSIEGIHDNPSRREADSVGKMVGIDFLINVLVNGSQPIKAFCGEPTMVHQTGIEYGDREVWAAEIHKKADVVIASPGSGNVPESGYDLKTLYRAARAAKESGTIICVAAREMSFEPKMNEPISEILRLHERRNWDLSEREIQWRIKSLRGKFYNYRQIKEIQKREVVLTPDPNAALQDVLAEVGTDIWLVVLPEARTTLPKEKLYRLSF
jgi:nickel-dependent lactate racemase